MDHGAFLRTVGRGDLVPVALLHGADAQLLEDALAAVSGALFPDAGSAAFDREVVDGSAITVDAVVRSALTLPLLARARLVAVRHAEDLAARGQDALARYCRAPSPTTCLLLLAAEPLAAGSRLSPTDRRRSDHWLLSAVPGEAVVALIPQTGRALETWLRQRAQAEGLAVSEEAARLLLQWVGEDRARLLGEARKAALAGGPEQRSVGAAEVTAVVGEHRVSDVFELTRAVERREAGPALRTLDRLLAVEEPLFVLAVLTREVRTAWTIREWRERGQSVDQIARILRRPVPVVEAIAAGPGVRALAHRLERCWEVERRLKSGGPGRAELTGLVVELCGSA